MSQFKRKKLFKNLGLGCGCASTTNSNATHVYEPKPIPKLKPRPSTLSSSNDGETYSSISPSTSSMLSSNWQSCNNENIDKKMITATASASATSPSPSVSRRWNNMGDQQTTDNISTTAVVMESENPYDDFQQSMLEMITENQIFSAEELLQLLHCFLSLNSPAHHHLILCAFFQVSQYAIVSSSK